MSECDEIAQSMLVPFRFWLGASGETLSMDSARRYVRIQMRDESMTLIDNVAWSLYQQARPSTS